MVFLIFLYRNLDVGWIKSTDKMFLSYCVIFDIFAYGDVHIVVYTLEENEVHAMSAEVIAEFCAEDDIKRYSKEFFFENCELETDFTKDSKSCPPTSDEQFAVLRKKDHKNRFFEHYLQHQLKELRSVLKIGFSVLINYRWWIDTPVWYVSWPQGHLFSTKIPWGQNSSNTPSQTETQCWKETRTT